MTGELIGQLILWLIVAVIVVFILYWVMHWLYRRSTKEVAFVRTGLGGSSFNGLQRHPMGAEARDLHAGDLDGDGRRDLIAAGEDLSQPLTLLMGSPSGLVSAPPLPSGFAAGGVRLAARDGAVVAARGNTGAPALALPRPGFHRGRCHRATERTMSPAERGAGGSY